MIWGNCYPSTHQTCPEFGYIDESQISPLLLALFCSSPSPVRQNICLFECSMLHFAQRLVSKLVCLNENNKLKDGKKKKKLHRAEENSGDTIYSGCNNIIVKY